MIFSFKNARIKYKDSCIAYEWVYRTRISSDWFVDTGMRMRVQNLPYKMHEFKNKLYFDS